MNEVAQTVPQTTQVVNPEVLKNAKQEVVQTAEDVGPEVLAQDQTKH